MLTQSQFQKIVTDPSKFVVIMPDGQQMWNTLPLNQEHKQVHLLSGSFNPLHNGHKSIYWHVQKHISNNIFYELSCNNFNKGSISLEMINWRIAQFQWYAPLIITNCYRFYDKIQYIKPPEYEISFHVGYDAAQFLTEQCYKKHEIEQLQCQFYVYPRGIDGKLLSIKDLQYIPNNFKSTCVKENVNAFLSSTNLRNQNCI